MKHPENSKLWKSNLWAIKVSSAWASNILDSLVSHKSQWAKGYSISYAETSLKMIKYYLIHTDFGIHIGKLNVYNDLPLWGWPIFMVSVLVSVTQYFSHKHHTSSHLRRCVWRHQPSHLHGHTSVTFLNSVCWHPVTLDTHHDLHPCSRTST